MNETVKRLLSGIVYIVLLISSIYLTEILKFFEIKNTNIFTSENSFFVLFAFFMIVAAYEYANIVSINKVFSILVAIIILASTYFFKLSALHYNLCLILTLLVSCKLIYFLFNNIQQRIDTQSKYIYLIGYIILPFVFLTKIPYGIKGFNPKIILSIFILIWTNDTFAYIVGKSIGKNKLFERISPKKTIEGFIGGLLFTIFAGYLISKFYINPSEKFRNQSIFIWVIISVIVALFGTIGDLVESKFKRVAGVKDSGTIMPGHGGVLDRLDSVIFVAPFIYLFYQILNYV